MVLIKIFNLPFISPLFLLFLSILLFQFTPVSSYQLSTLHYPSNNIKLYIEDCPTHLDCIPIIIETANKWKLPGISFNINWYVKDSSKNYDMKNEVIFKYDEQHYGFTVFQHINNEIINFKIYVNPFWNNKRNPIQYFVT